MLNITEMALFVAEQEKLVVDLHKLSFRNLTAEEEAEGATGQMGSDGKDGFTLAFSSSHVWDDIKFYGMLAHELKHLEQYQTGRLSHTGVHWVFDGKFYSDSMPYEKQPWEIEAFDFQRKAEAKQYLYKVAAPLVNLWTKLQTQFTTIMPVIGY